MRVRCPMCGATCRVMQVDEADQDGVKVTYTCPNTRCGGYGGAVTTRILPRATDPDEEPEGEAP